MCTSVGACVLYGCESERDDFRKRICMSVSKNERKTMTEGERRRLEGSKGLQREANNPGKGD